MKRHMPKTGWIGIIASLVLLVGMCGSAFGSSGVVRDVEADLGIMLAPAAASCHPCDSWDAVVLQPEKLAELGLTGVGKGDALRIVHQVDNLWQVVDTQNGVHIRIRLRLKTGAAGHWPFLSTL